MSKTIRGVSLAAVLISLSACAPPGQGALGFRDIDWPRADHFMTPDENREIEILLGRLSYLKSGADTQIDATTRAAIRTYQRDIGAPITGYVSLPLLQSLRVNAPVGPAIETIAPPTATTVQRTSTPTPRRATPSVRTAAPNTGGGGSGGSGGQGGGAWN